MHVRFLAPMSVSRSLFGDKRSARDFAVKCDVPVVQGKESVESAEEVLEFLDATGLKLPVPALVESLSGVQRVGKNCTMYTQ